jgi:hypothetical protein
LSAASTGTRNIAIGFQAGASVTTGSDNIHIGTEGSPGDSDTIRIGTAAQTATFVGGIHGATSSGGIAVLVNSSGQLGTTTSSRRFKEDIADVGSLSAKLLELRPVKFHYRREALHADDAARLERPLELGLIAEEVAEVLPELVVYDDEGAPYTVRYHLLVPLLLAELQRQERESAEQRAALEELRRLLRGATGR